MSVVALIPARGGSKRVPNKNLQVIGKSSLVATAIRTAFDAEIFDKVVLSTDSDEIAAHAGSQFHDLTIFKRRAELAQDDTPMLPVVRDFVDEYARAFGTPPQTTVLLQPTSPFRTVSDIQNAYKLYQERGADAVVSVTEPETDLVFRIGHAGVMRTAPGVVVSNGAIYILDHFALMCGHDWFSGISYAYYMSRDRSIDIDTPLDLAIAKAVVENENAVA